MKFIISESKLEKIILNYLDDFLDLKKFQLWTNKKNPHSLFFVKDGKLLLWVDKKHRNFFYEYDDIYEFLRSFFSLNDEQVTEIMDKWFIKKFKDESFSIIPENINDWYEENSQIYKGNWVKV